MPNFKPNPMDPDMQAMRDKERANMLTRVGRELTPEESKWLYDYHNKPATGGFPIGGSVGPMPSSPMPRGGGMGALHLDEGPGGPPPGAGTRRTPRPQEARAPIEGEEEEIVEPDMDSDDPRPWMGDDMRYEEGRRRRREGR